MPLTFSIDLEKFLKELRLTAKDIIRLARKLVYKNENGILVHKKTKSYHCPICLTQLKADFPEKLQTHKTAFECYQCNRRFNPWGYINSGVAEYKGL